MNCICFLDERYLHVCWYLYFLVRELILFFYFINFTIQCCKFYEKCESLWRCKQCRVDVHTKTIHNIYSLPVVDFHINEHSSQPSTNQQPDARTFMHIKEKEKEREKARDKSKILKIGAKNNRIQFMRWPAKQKLLYFQTHKKKNN